MAITAPILASSYLQHIGGGGAATEKGETEMGVLEVILIGFIGVNAVLGLSSLVTVRW